MRPPKTRVLEVPQGRIARGATLPDDQRRNDIAQSALTEADQPHELPEALVARACWQHPPRHREIAEGDRPTDQRSDHNA